LWQRPKENLPLGYASEKISNVRNVFVEKWPSLAMFVLVAGAVLFVMVRWA
jgi:hypothetical protein